MKFKASKVNVIWNKKLTGKKGYVADNINELIEIVEGRCCSEVVTVSQSPCDARPFEDDIGLIYRFFYPVRG